MVVLYICAVAFMLLLRLLTVIGHRAVLGAVLQLLGCDARRGWVSSERATDSLQRHPTALLGVYREAVEYCRWRIGRYTSCRKSSAGQPLGLYCTYVRTICARRQ
jgi:hypothetical protein